MYAGCKPSQTLQVFTVNLTYLLSLKYTLLKTQFWCLAYILYYWFIELPWDQPTKKYKEYSDWINGCMHRTPWTKMEKEPLGVCFDFWHLLFPQTSFDSIFLSQLYTNINFISCYCFIGIDLCNVI